MCSAATNSLPLNGIGSFFLHFRFQSESVLNRSGELLEEIIIRFHRHCSIAMATRRKVREWSCRRCGREPFHREVEKELGITPAEIRDLVERETDARYSDVYPPRENEFEITIDALELGDIDGGTLLRARMDSKYI